MVYSWFLNVCAAHHSRCTIQPSCIPGEKHYTYCWMLWTLCLHFHHWHHWHASNSLSLLVWPYLLVSCLQCNVTGDSRYPPYGTSSYFSPPPCLTNPVHAEFNGRWASRFILRKDFPSKTLLLKEDLHAASGTFPLNISVPVGQRVRVIFANGASLLWECICK